MFTKTAAGYFLLTFLLATDQALGREKWFERNNRAIFLHPRRFGQEQPAVLQKLRDACPGEVCGNLAGQAVTPLLAGQPECTQQDMADSIIDASKQFDNATQTAMIAIAQEYRQAEKNTPPDFSTNPPTLRNSVFCQVAPKNPELNGLVQAQDPANDPSTFFDPATQKSVKKGDQPNTFPFGDPDAANSNNLNIDMSLETASAGDATATAIGAHVSYSACIATAITVTVSATNPAVATITNAITVTAGSKTGAPAATATGLAGDADFGSCSTPEIEFGVGFDNRKETSFRPVDSGSFPHGSAQNIDIISQFICDSLTNTCDANQAAKDLCATATAASDSATAGTGAQADAFNAVFGISTNFSDVQSVDDNGNPVPGTGAASGGGNNKTSTTITVNTAATTLTTVSPATASSTAAAGGNADFGTCSTPQIEFGAGFDGRKETSFQPTDKTSFNHGSAQDINIITQFICGQVTNACKANQAAKDLCAEAATAASNAAPPQTGAQADAFNAVFGIQTDFADVQPIDDQGRPAGNSEGVSQPAMGSTPTVTRSTSQASPATSATSAINLANNTSNLQKFSGALRGIRAPVVRNLGGGKFGVDGTNSPFNDEQSAVARSCDIQNNQCADAANASGNKDGFTVQACNQQQSECKTANNA